MKVRILGCGTSSGVPRVGGDWGDCDSADPRNRRLRSSILVDIAGESILVDCGPDLREQLLAVGRGTVDRLIVTHDHADHCHGIDELRVVAQNLGKPVPLHARADVLERLQGRFRYAVEGLKLYPPVIDGEIVADDWHLGEARIRFVDQPHGGRFSLGLRFEEGPKSFGYAIDFHDMTPDMLAMYEGCDVWIADCLRRRPHPTHAHLDAVLGWAREMKVGQLLLTHLDNSMDYATLCRELPDWAAPAFDGQEMVLA